MHIKDVAGSFVADDVVDKDPDDGDEPVAEEEKHDLLDVVLPSSP